jgi:hypothetical protein
MPKRASVWRDDEDTEQLGCPSLIQSGERRCQNNLICTLHAGSAEGLGAVPPASIDVYGKPLSRQRDLSGRSCTVILNPEKRKVGGSTPPLTTALTCTDVRLVIVKVQLVTLVVSFLGHLPQADGRISHA